MDDSQCNGSSSNDKCDGCVESLFSSSDDPSDHYLSPSFQDLEIVESILAEMLENEARLPETKAAELAMDPMSPPPGDSSGGVLLEEVENDEEIAREDESCEDQNSTEASSAKNIHHVQHPTTTLSSPSSPSSVEAEPVEPAVQDPVALRMKELVYCASLFELEKEVEKKKKRKRKNVETSSKDPETRASRKRREKISENIRVLQSLVPGGNKMGDITTLLDEVIGYLMFLDKYVKTAEPKYIY